MKKYVYLVLLLLLPIIAEAQVSMYAEPIFSKTWTDISLKQFPMINLPNDLDIKRNQTFWELGILSKMDWLDGRVFWLLGNRNTGSGSLAPVLYDSAAKDVLPVNVENTFNSWRFELGVSRNIRGILLEPFFVTQYNNQYFKLSTMNRDTKTDKYNRDVTVTGTHSGVGANITLPVYSSGFCQLKGFITDRDYMIEMRYGFGINALLGTFGWTYRVYDTGVEHNIRNTINGPFLSIGVSF